MTRGVWHRAAAAVLAVGVAVALVAGCTPKRSSDDRPAPHRTPVTQGAPAGFETYYGQKVDWESCRGVGDGDYQCAQITAPKDWSDAGGGDIELSVIVHLASSGTAKGSLFVNPGGPGASGVDLVQQAASFAVGDELLDSYDVVGFDPRGVGRSTAVRCLDAAAMDRYLFAIPSAPRGTPERTAEQQSSAESFARACDSNSDGLLPYVTTENAARDLDLLRGVLGDEKLSYLGYSYGSFLGATYADLFPKNVGRVVLDGGLDPSIPSAIVGARQAAGFQSAFDAYLASCLTGSDCPFSGTEANARQQMGDALAAVDASPLTASDGRKLGADSLVTGIVSALYSEGNWSSLSSAITGVLEGDADEMFELVDRYYNRYDGQYLDNSTEAFSAYNCMDYPRRPGRCRGGRERRGGGEGADLRAVLVLRREPLRRVAVPADRLSQRDPRGGCRPDPRHRHDQRPRNPVRVVCRSREAAELRHPAHSCGGGAHGLQQGKRVHRRRRRGVLRGRQGAGRRPPVRGAVRLAFAAWLRTL
ncbi:pimeloyl-ACP methyl ester carboxylesterase [Microbacterium sp. SORGH_AS 505]|nr:pimeloyl-ACP methyl ester carboxylesterase [Microbacterium sp. SORGH_AS_0505]